MVSKNTFLKGKKRMRSGVADVAGRQANTGLVMGVSEIYESESEK